MYEDICEWGSLHNRAETTMQCDSGTSTYIWYLLTGPYLFSCLFFCPLLTVWMFEIAGQRLERQIVYITIPKKSAPCLSVCKGQSQGFFIFSWKRRLRLYCNRLASSLDWGPNPRSGGHKFDRLGPLTEGGKNLGVRSFYSGDHDVIMSWLTCTEAHCLSGRGRVTHAAWHVTRVLTC